MNFTRIVAENFLSIGKLDMSLEKRGLLVLVGENQDDPSASSNGSGKSSLVESIYYGLYGKTLRGIKYVDGVINRRTQRDCRVFVALTVKAGSLEVERFRKHSTGKDRLIVRLDGKELHATKPAETQRALNDLLGMDAEMFSRLVFVGQGFAQRFTDMDDRSLKEFIEGMSGSLLYAEAHTLVKADVAKFEQERDFVVNEIARVESHLKHENESLAAARLEAEKQEKARTETLVAMITTRTALELSRNRIEQRLAEIKKDYEDAQKKFDLLLSEERKKLAEKQDERLLVNQTYSKKKEEALSKYHQKVAEIDAEIQGITGGQASMMAQVAAKTRVLDEVRTEFEKKRWAERNSIIRAGDEAYSRHSASVDALEKEISSFRPLGVSRKTADALAQVEAELKVLAAREVEIASGVGKNCPACGQVVTEDSARQHAHKVYDIDGQRRALTDRLEAAKTAVNVEEEAARVEEARRTGVLQQLQQGKTARAGIADVNRKALMEFDEATAKLRVSDEPDRKKLQALTEQLQVSCNAQISQKEAARKTLGEEYKSEVDVINREEAAAMNAISVAAIENNIHNLEEDKRDDTLKFTSSTTTISGEYTKTDREIAALEASKAELERKSFSDVVSAISKSVEKLESELGVRKKALLAAEDSLYVATYLATAFGMSGIRSYMLDSILSFINERLKAHCQYLFDGRVLIELSPVHEQKNKTVVEKITLTVATDGGSYDASSGGERRKVDVALFLAFRDLNRTISPSRPNVEAYDEILSFLDGESASRVVQLLASDTSVETKILITHRSDVPIVGAHQLIKAVKKSGITEYIFS